MPPCPNSCPMFPPAEHFSTIYLSRHGESQNNLHGKIGGNADLSERGGKYAKVLGSFITSLKLPGLKVWMTQYRRTQQTAEFIDAPKHIEPALGEICAGDHDGMTYEEIAEKFPVEFALRDADKLCYRYPNGESYMDVVERIKPLLQSIKEEDNLFIISHQATLRCLLTMILGYPSEDLPYLKVPLHTVIKLSFMEDEVKAEYYRLPVECVDTHRVKPNNCEITRQLDDACVTVPFHL
eukprot:GFUD01079143.1.p1 GENE.GFUD01079143.1~~GFUD01079143.1.p1  ORF type:complete len:238 (+),score=59.78 GFUD01079143.1:207-920(+)